MSVTNIRKGLQPGSTPLKNQGKLEKGGKGCKGVKMQAGKGGKRGKV